MKTFVKPTNSESTYCRSACQQARESSNGDTELIIGAKRENYEAGRTKLACVKGELATLQEQQPIPCTQILWDLDKIQTCSHTFSTFRSDVWSLGISESTKPATAASASYYNLFPTSACHCVNSNISLLNRPSAVKLQPIQGMQLTCSHWPISLKRKGKRCQHHFLPCITPFLQHLCLTYPMGNTFPAKQSQR